MNLRSYGSSALLVELDSPVEAMTLRARLEATPLAGALETMPGLQTVLIRFDPRLTDEVHLAQALAQIELGPEPWDAAPNSDVISEVCVQVDYSGPDLAEVAAHTGMSVGEVIDAHQACHYRVVLIGMAPGFYFLSGGDPRLQPPRRSTPRTDVARGAVGLAGHFTGIYPRLGPGGWQLVGRVIDDLWHPSRVPAALLPPGTSIRFTAA